MKPTKELPKQKKILKNKRQIRSIGKQGFFILCVLLVFTSLIILRSVSKPEYSEPTSTVYGIERSEVLKQQELAKQSTSMQTLSGQVSEMDDFNGLVISWIPMSVVATVALVVILSVIKIITRRF